jgi:hypothetical protein
VVSNGRYYLGPRVSVGDYKEGMEPPVVYWVPAIAVSGLTFYTGDKFPRWKNNLFVGGMRQGELPRSGQLERIDFNDKWEELHRESMFHELQNRIRDVRQGPDGLLYVLTEENDGALLKMGAVGCARAGPVGYVCAPADFRALLRFTAAWSGQAGSGQIQTRSAKAGISEETISLSAAGWGCRRDQAA